MVIIELELNDIKTTFNSIDVSAEGLDFDLRFLYNNYDEYLYMRISDLDGNILLGDTRVLPEIDYFSINPQKTDFSQVLIFIKTNDNAIDKITADNIGKDYKLFLGE